MIIGSCTLYKGLQGTRERKRSQGRNIEHRNSRISISDEGVELKTVTNWIISFTGVMADNFLHPLSDFEHIEPSEAILQNMIHWSIIIVNVKLVENHDLRPCRNVLQKKWKSNHESMHAWQNWPQRAGFRGKSCITAICWNNPHMDSIESRQESCGKDISIYLTWIGVSRLRQRANCGTTVWNVRKSKKNNFSSAVNRYGSYIFSPYLS